MWFSHFLPLVGFTSLVAASPTPLIRQKRGAGNGWHFNSIGYNVGLPALSSMIGGPAPKIGKRDEEFYPRYNRYGTGYGFGPPPFQSGYMLLRKRHSGSHKSKKSNNHIHSKNQMDRNKTMQKGINKYYNKIQKRNMDKPYNSNSHHMNDMSVIYKRSPNGDNSFGINSEWYEPRMASRNFNKLLESFASENNPLLDQIRNSQKRSILAFGAANGMGPLASAQRHKSRQLHSMDWRKRSILSYGAANGINDLKPPNKVAKHNH